ncbi:unannotated protein [freshwater metagenome]|uniref:Unannotated protein n=1 Tax=freshwater metagenome TaxID=449393 RepID=A0A6J7FYS3_9ZZZZ
MYVVSRYGCPSSVYAKLNILEKGVVVSYTNDVLGGLEPMQKDLMKFETYESISGKAIGRLREISCY